jgi:hypothetical protein
MQNLAQISTGFIVINADEGRKIRIGAMKPPVGVA